MYRYFIAQSTKNVKAFMIQAQLFKNDYYVCIHIIFNIHKAKIMISENNQILIILMYEVEINLLTIQLDLIQEGFDNISKLACCHYFIFIFLFQRSARETVFKFCLVSFMHAASVCQFYDDKKFKTNIDSKMIFPVDEKRRIIA